MSNELSADKLKHNAQAAHQKGRHLEAAKLFEAARQAFLTSDREVEAAEMANNASVAYLLGGYHDLALQSVEDTPAIFARLGDLKRQGMALGNQAAACEALGRTEQAIALYEESASILEKANEDQLRANVMQSLSMLQFKEGKQLQALASMSEGLEGVKRPNPKQFMLKKLLRIPFQLITPNKNG